jgi:predicted outer membrane repeat protein
MVFDRIQSGPTADSLMEILPSPTATVATKDWWAAPPLNVNQSRSLLFIDAGVADAQTLIQAAAPGTEVHLLNPAQDAIQQITQTLLGREGIASLQILSHGASGGLQLGQDWLNAASLQSYASQFASWQSALTQEADILLYGCEVASGELGQAFVQILSQLTGADVAASDDLTGQGGDWVLEVQTGSISTLNPLASDALQTYGGTLDGAYDWANAIGGADFDEGRGIAVDSSGNVHITGSFRGTVDFDPGAGTTNLISAGGADIFVAKYTNAGNLIWAKRLDGANTDVGHGIAVDSSGNVYTTGYFTGTADFDPSANTATLTSAGDTDIFVSSLSSTGDYRWAQRLGGTANDVGNGITVDSSGSVYTTGYFTGTADFDPSTNTANLTSSGDTDIFVSSLSASAGGYLWARRLGGTDSDYGYGIALDSTGKVYTTGTFRGTVDFNPGAGTADLTSAGSFDVFVSSLTSTGDYLWAQRLGGTSSDFGYAIAIDTSNNIYTTGYFAGNVDFDPGASTANLISAGGSDDIFISSLTSAGDYRWAQRFGSASGDYGFGIAVDSSSNVYTTGYFTGTVDFDPSTGTTEFTSPNANSDVFISSLTSAGNYRWAQRLGGVSGDFGNGIAVDSNGDVYTTGYFYGTADFDPGVGTAERTSTDADIFVSSLTQSTTLTLTAGVTPVENTPTNGSFTLTVANPSATPLTVNYSIGGTAINGSDYTLVAGAGITNLTATSFTLAAGVTTATFIVQMVNDIQAEANETVQLSLAAGTGYIAPTTTPVTLTIGQNDFVVTNTNDNGEGSLRQAILNANAISGTDTITFAGTMADATADIVTLTSGELFIGSNLTISSTGANLLTINGNNASSVFSIGSSATVNFSGLTIINGSRFEGGGIYNLGNLTVSSSTFSGNTARDTGGGIYNRGSLTVNSSTFSNNIADDSGGGIFNRGSLTVNSSTFSSNTAKHDGGGIQVFDGTANLTHLTLTGNRADSDTNGDGDGGGISRLNGSVTIGSSIIASNTDDPSGNNRPDVSGDFIDSGNNLIGNSTGSTSFTTSTLVGTAATPINPLLSALGNYGGPTQTHALLPGSRAINAGIGTSGSDQRGSAAVGTRDIGAFESRGFTIAATGGTPQSAPPSSAFATPLVVTVTANNAAEPVAGGQVTYTAPASGASATLSSGTATIGATGNASVNATANNTLGSYTVNAGGNGIASPASFSLTNNNNAPVLNATPSPTLAAVNEDAGTPSGAVGTLVSSLVDFSPPASGLNNVTDADTGAVTGIAITAANTANGSWFYSTDNGANWTALGAVSNTTARLLAADANTRVYFQPTANYNGSITNALTFRAWDQTSGTNGSTADTNTNGGTTAFSSVTDTAAITVNAVNDAPVLDATASPTLAAVNEDAGAPTGVVGTLVSSLVDLTPPADDLDNVTDSDAGAVTGIAITAADSTNGSWFYSTNNGTNWTALGTVSNATARLLAADANTRVYFQPSANYNGTVTNALTFRAWDQTSGTNGNTTDTSSNGGTTAFSSVTDTVALTVNAVNDAPSFTAGANQTIAAGAAAQTVTGWATSFIAGPANESSQTVQQYQIVGNSNPGLFTVAPTIATNGTLTYTPVANLTTPGTATITVQVQDSGGTANSGIDTSPTQTFTITVNPQTVSLSALERAAIPAAIESAAPPATAANRFSCNWMPAAAPPPPTITALPSAAPALPPEPR